jgi:hypothetical protein
VLKFDRIENGIAVFTHDPLPQKGFNGEIEWYTETRLNRHNVKTRIENLQREAPYLDLSAERMALFELDHDLKRRTE